MRFWICCSLSGPLLTAAPQPGIGENGRPQLMMYSTSSRVKRSSTVLSAGARQLTVATNFPLSASRIVYGAWPPVPSGPWQFWHCEPSTYRSSPRLTKASWKVASAPSMRPGSFSQYSGRPTATMTRRPAPTAACG